MSRCKTTSVFFRARLALANPQLAWSYFRRLARIRELSGVDNRTVQAYYKAGLSSPVLTEINKLGQDIKSLGGPGYCGRSLELYVLIRILKPTTVIETGVANGLSSAFILQSLEDNRTGRLVSVDFPQPDLFLPPERETGWLVPEELRGRWDLHVGKSLDLLPGILGRLKSVDVFLHDSDHSYQYMKSELETVWPFLSERSVILVDDAWGNPAFAEFAAKIGRRAIMIANLGAIRK